MARTRAWLLLLDRRAAWCAAGFVILATVRIGATYREFNHTIDEPAHIACGMEWLSKGSYKLEPQHPPLSRIFNAMGPYLAGSRSTGRDVIYKEGAAILTAAGDYQRRLTLARIGTLPFFWLACAALYWLALMEFGRAQAAAAAALFSLTPGVLGHAGLATTDMALTGTFLLTAASFVWWSRGPDWKRGMALGVSAGLLLAAKFSALFFLPLFLGVWLVMRRAAAKEWVNGRSTVSLGIAALAGLLTVWSVYRFSFGPTPYGFPAPAPELLAGIEQARAHNAEGHASYLMGQRNKIGFLLFYPVAFGVKTPVPLLLLGLAGWWMIWKRRREGAVAALAIAAAMLATGFLSNINIGTRHLLPLYGALAAGAAVAAVAGLERGGWGRRVVIGLLAWLVIGPLTDHPDNLAYFNFLAGSEPEKILVDSDLDWGQDMLRLSRRLKEVGAEYVVFNPFIVANWHRDFGFPPIAIGDPVSPMPGWNAVSLTVWKSGRMGLGDEHPEAQLWPDRFSPAERVGRGVYLYYFDPKMFANPPQLERFPSP